MPPTENQVKGQIQSNITDKTAPGSISPANVGDSMEAIVDYAKEQDLLKADKASPVFSGNPTGPTPAAGDNDTSLATTAFVQQENANDVEYLEGWEYVYPSAGGTLLHLDKINFIIGGNPVTDKVNLPVTTDLLPGVQLYAFCINNATIEGVSGQPNTIVKDHVITGRYSEIFASEGDNYRFTYLGNDTWKSECLMGEVLVVNGTKVRSGGLRLDAGMPGTVAPTAAELNSNFPDNYNINGLRVWYTGLASGPRVYTKMNGNWYWINATLLT